MTYQPPQEIVERYAGLLVNYALGGGQGIESGDVVLVRGSEDAKPLFVEVCRAVWRAGGHVIQQYEPAEDGEQNLRGIFFEEASDAQLDFFPADYQRGLVDQVDHLAFLWAERDPRAMRDADPQKMMRAQRALLPLVQWRQEKENAGELTWTIGMWGTEGMASEARMPLEEYWQQIIGACFLDDPDPIARWRSVVAQIDQFKEWLNSLRDRAAARRGRGRRPVADARRAAPLAGRRWTQHPELRDLHLSRLAWDRGPDPVQRARVLKRIADQWHRA